MSRLIDNIKKYQDNFKQRVSKDIQKIMLEATQKLKDEKLSKNALKVSDIAKDFTLKNPLNKDVNLNKLLEENNFVVLNFYRGAWCPYCNLELKALESINKTLIRNKAKLVAISPQTPDASLTTKEKNELTFEVLSDTNNEIAKEYGLVFSLADELKPIYKNFGINIPKSNNEDSFNLPMPATYVINKNKEIIYAFIDEDYTSRSEPQEILDIIAKNS
ncbi:peroxiredoxin-like family protein [Arcobacter sp. YIC-464]|uniref:peroxiredoxin-like family protein n=1 Tax=Arcobacter sp. YIC-464 TaxID=3376631 RepID=UPI003C28682C